MIVFKKIRWKREIREKRKKVNERKSEERRYHRTQENYETIQWCEYTKLPLMNPINKEYVPIDKEYVPIDHQSLYVPIGNQSM